KRRAMRSFRDIACGEHMPKAARCRATTVPASGVRFGLRFRRPSTGARPPEPGSSESGALDSAPPAPRERYPRSTGSSSAWPSYSVARRTPFSDLGAVEKIAELRAQLGCVLVAVILYRVCDSGVDQVLALTRRRHDHELAVALARELAAVR